jgi:site-specific DNA-cytosine methylase
VPQRRKRIYLVADFTGRRAGEILFKPDSLRGDLQTGDEAGQEAAVDAMGGTNGGIGAVGFLSTQGSKAMGIGFAMEQSPTLRAGLNGADVVILNDQGGSSINVEQEEISPTLRANSHQHEPVIALQANGIDRADTAGCNGCGWRYNESYTLNTIDRHAVCFDRATFNQGINAQYDFEVLQEGIVSTVVAKGPSGVCYDTRGTVIVKKSPRKYIIRRLTPTECARLQGFPDWWSTLAPYNPADAEFWEDVRKTHAEINGKKYKPVKDIKKWYDKLHTDSAEYKMWGNGIALPNAEYVMYGVASQGAKTLGSLFDGSGGFPLAGILNGITPLWSSEVEPYPIAVTKSRFEGV